MELVVLIIYGIALFAILLHGFLQFSLILNSRKYRKNNILIDRPALSINEPEKLPFVTVQLPVYNEYYVVSRLIDAVAALDYDPDKIEIQVLDDSNDETKDVIQQKVKALQDQNIDIHHIHRQNRTGYKAGALADGLMKAKGEFIAIFDADFIPSPDFLLNTLPHFTADHIGMVQTRWGHVNDNYSLLTKLQAFGLNAHFRVEQAGRYQAGNFLNFNGTGGVWRKKCIIDAGNWQHDTLAEDLDLSYRAQLKGWEFVYVDHVEAPAELPVIMSALKSQQYRWTKGGAENFRKLKSQILKSDLIPFKTKLYALAHLMNNSLFILIFLIGMLSIPALIIKLYNKEYNLLFYLGSIFLIAMVIFFLFYWSAFHYKKNKWFKPVVFIYHFILFLSFSMGLSLHNSLAAIEGYFGKKSSFIRTPKFNVNQKGRRNSNLKYLSKKISWITWLEGLIALYFLIGVGTGIFFKDYGLVPFHLMFAFGFGAVFYYSIKQLWIKQV
jgi:cellulose synthase/poly-beta-1,6-N-acetylglucosamine synthase-like glycosyltransferase